MQYEKAPSDMFFESEIRPEQDGRFLLDSLCERFTYHSRIDWVDRLTRGLVTLNGEVAGVDSIAHRGDKVVYHVENYSEPEVPTNFTTVFEDDEFLLVAKPAGVPVHHTGRIFYNTFAAIIRRAFDCESATPMHRLDRDTGGLMLFAKDASTASRFQKNLDRILLRKFYLAVVPAGFPDGPVPDEHHFAKHGRRVSVDKDGFVDCVMPLREDPADPIRLRMHHFYDGKPCHTRFRKLFSVEHPDLGTLDVVEAELLTGRKHQIRAHLAELGFPIVGDRLYSHGGAYYDKMTRGELGEDDYRVLGAHHQMLFAYRVQIRLPYWDEPREFSSFDFPPDMAQLLAASVDRLKSK